MIIDMVEKIELDPPEKLKYDKQRILIDTLILKGEHHSGKTVECIALYKGMPLFIRPFRLTFCGGRAYISVADVYRFIGYEG